ncbi:D-alanyl-D-alanine carboxypeptidase [Oscillospiraceae bacterium HV4-5-C5C]|nr:D-alanyl-D-alanine carboxypeptidase [Oscillospiraceae bacterium HV4-5-C5C]
MADYSFLDLQPVSQSVLIKEADHGTTLYAEQASQPDYAPLAHRILTAVIALEYLDSKTMLTISKTAAQYIQDRTVFTTGGRYDLYYVLHALILEDSQAAAVALAEEISGSEADFVKLLNNHARSLGMSGTQFTNVTGVYDEAQYTTAEDLYLLYKYAMSVSSFKAIYNQRDRTYYYSLNINHYFVNHFSYAWNYADQVQGGMISKQGQDYSAVYTVRDSVQDYTYTVFLSGSHSASSLGQNSVLITDIIAINRQLRSHYEKSILAYKGETFDREYQLAGKTVALAFQETVSYVHPLGDDFRQQTTLVMNDSPPGFPILTDETLGYVWFSLDDGSTIQVPVASSTEIHSRNQLLDRLLVIIDSNKTLTGLILVVFLALLGLLILKLRQRRLQRQSQRHS